MVVLATLLFGTVAVPASAAVSAFEGFGGSFLRAFIAYTLLFVSAHLVSFLLARRGFVEEQSDEEETTISLADND